ncbi:hypothetical protein KIH27_04865 [Mycobacterium sp. M1]|uniref:Uncharacterized protein n=1 Tax=Mycolicibacter acidiphilus TaxID=2835306 RepID=A0ABS5RFE2_9MYCO|nr:hypothetical protein [Mycolicibacter acidiphilus]MBS9532919.1 hypothetical protein [Mycolicibacter acidiphilus]
MIDGLPSLAEIEATTVDHLTDLADYLTAQAARIRHCFTEAHEIISTAPWQGQAYNAAYRRSDADRVIAVREAEQRITAAGIARRGAENMLLARTATLGGVAEARAAGFEVRQDLVCNAHTPGRSWEEAVRLQPQANELTAKIRVQAASMVYIDQDTTSKLATATASFGTLKFTETPIRANNGHGIQLVDHTWKQAPSEGPTEPAGADGGAGRPYDPNPRYPGRNNLGHYTKGNTGSADGAAAAEERLKQYEKDNHTSVIRQQIRVAMTDPKTGEIRYRYYDALEPLPGHPGQYRGIEVKSGGANWTPSQRIFDTTVSPNTPARGTLNGQPVEVITARKIDAPAFVPPSVAGADGGAAAGTATGGSPAPVISPQPAGPTVLDHPATAPPMPPLDHPAPVVLPPTSSELPLLPPGAAAMPPESFDLLPPELTQLPIATEPPAGTTVTLHPPPISGPTPEQLKQAGEVGGTTLGFGAVLALLATLLSPT